MRSQAFDRTSQQLFFATRYLGFKFLNVDGYIYKQNICMLPRLELIVFYSVLLRFCNHPSTSETCRSRKLMGQEYLLTLMTKVYLPAVRGM